MGTDYERREAREDERRQAELDRDRRADHAPGLPVLRTPREEVEAYIASAAEWLLGDPELSRDGGRRSVAGALRWLDRAREVLKSPNVIDGAALLRSTVQEALDAAEEGDSAVVIGRLEDALELLDRQVRAAPGDEIPVARDDFESSDRAEKRRAVLAVLMRHRMELSIGEASTGLLEEIVAAVETGI